MDEERIVVNGDDGVWEGCESCTDGVFDKLVKEDRVEGVVLACRAANAVANCCDAVLMGDWGWYIELDSRIDGPVDKRDEAVADPCLLSALHVASLPLRHPYLN